MAIRKKPVLEPTSFPFIDALRDENEAYTRKLMQAGVNVATARVLAAFHRLRHVECFGRYARSKVATQLLSRRTGA
jgi:acetyl esterase/lipase